MIDALVYGIRRLGQPEHDGAEAAIRVESH
jgi:hypothetical protein